MEEEKDLQMGAGEKKEAIEDKDNLPVIRTFKSDSSRYIKEEKISAIDIASAQIKRGGSLRYGDIGERKQFNWQKIFIALLAVIIFVSLGLGSFYLFKKFQGGAEAPTYVLPEPVIIADEEIESDFGNMDSIIQGPLKTGRLLYIPLVTETSLDVKRLITGREFFNNFEITPPSDMLGDLDNQFMLYVYRSDENYPLLIFGINSYERVFAAMIRWEIISFVSDFKNIFSVDYNSGSKPIFIDKDIKNHDARVLINEEGRSVLMYSILNKKYLIITTSQDALEEIFRRFSLPQYLND
ncbi:hypothetical protein KJ763_02090 [Patescibacteria group bacterium]|nr:hypothetical protein [Patescibacteria group bacterium]